MRHPGGIPIALAEWEGLMESYALLIAATLNAGTVLAIAALGLLINEKVGVVNLGAEGMMLCAAIAGLPQWCTPAATCWASWQAWELAPCWVPFLGSW